MDVGALHTYACGVGCVKVCRGCLHEDVGLCARVLVHLDVCELMGVSNACTLAWVFSRGCFARVCKSVQEFVCTSAGVGLGFASECAIAEQFACGIAKGGASHCTWMGVQEAVCTWTWGFAHLRVWGWLCESVQGVSARGCRVLHQGLCAVGSV